MHRFLASLCSLPLLAVAVHAQCFESNFGVLCPNSAGAPGLGDDLLFDLLPMNITFPMGGVAATYTHAHICSNGGLYLTNGLASGATNYGYQTAATWLPGTAGQPPRISAMWCDLDNLAVNGGGVFYNDTIPNKFVVTWSNTVEWATGGPPVFTVQLQLLASGEVVCIYTSNAASVQTAPTGAITGISEGNGIAATPAVDLSVGGNVSTTNFMFEQFAANSFDLNGKAVQFVPTGTGYVQVVTTCPTAFHDPYGSGCYNISDSFYQLLDDATLGAAALNGQSMVMSPAGSNYLVQWGGGTYVVPSGSAVSLVVGDDGETNYAPSIPFPTPGGPVSPLYIGANGIISSAANTATSGDYTPDAPTFLNSAITAFYSWHDYNPAEPGSGAVKYHEAVVGPNTIAYVTWDGVENYSTPAAVNPSTMQFQLNLTTGAVTIVWQSIDANSTSAFGSAHLVGWSPGGPSSDGGSLNLATALPLVTSVLNVNAMSLAAAPAPVSNAVVGTVVTYTSTGMPEYSTGAGIYIGMNVISLNQVPAGLDLFFIGAPGCRAYVSTLDFTQAMVGLTSTNSVTITIPTLVPTGTQLYSQSVTLIAPNSLPNGQNAFGMTLSNGIRSYIAPF